MSDTAALWLIRAFFWPIKGMVIYRFYLWYGLEGALYMAFCLTSTIYLAKAFIRWHHERWG